MKEFCTNHGNKKALSFCHSCKEYFCADCLDEGNKYYYCKKESCQNAKQNENDIYEEVNRTKGSKHPKIIINEKAVGFCEKCLEETKSKSISDHFLFEISLRKGMLLNERDSCDKCGSVRMDLSKPLPFFSFIRTNVGPFRIIKTWDLDCDALYLHRNKYISREVNKNI